MGHFLPLHVEMPTFIVVRRIFYSVLLINFKNWLHLTIKSQNVVIFVSTTYSWLQSSYLRSHLEDGEIKRLRINFILHKEVVIGIIQKGSSSLYMYRQISYSQYRYLAQLQE